jgi:hypothetical protein
MKESLLLAPREMIGVSDEAIYTQYWAGAKTIFPESGFAEQVCPLSSSRW